MRLSLAAVALCAGTFVFFVSPSRHAGESAEVLLRSERGSAAPVMTTGRHVRLRIDVTDVEPAAAFTVTVAGATGETVARTTARADAGAVKVSFDRALPPGSYWVRLATPEGRLLREYALRVQP
jgi:type II secretory pathway component PulM